LFNRIVVLILVGPVFMLSGCASFYSTTSAELVLDDPIWLENELNETSGLYCEADAMLTLNDSGNDAEVFHLGYEGSLISTEKLALDNLDWEAISASDSYWYIADVGNNKGKRKQLSIYKVKRDALNDVTQLDLTYEGNSPERNMPYAHDFDAEAMVMADNKLLLFSKSWRTGVSRVYEVNESNPSQMLEPVAFIEGLPGVITGADYDKSRHVYVVVGYRSDPFGNFAAFIAQLTRAFEPINIWPLPTYKQVEGVCVDKQGKYWFTEEATKHRDASLTGASIISN